MVKKQITLSQALEGYFIHAHARWLSPNILTSNDWAYRRLETFLKTDPPLAAITIADIRAYLNSLTGLSNKSVLNQHIALSVLWSWGVKERLVERNIIRDIPPPRPEKRDIVPFSKGDIQLMLKACKRSQDYTWPGKRRCDLGRPTALRDRGILMLLLVTGIRASELCHLRLFDPSMLTDIGLDPNELQPGGRVYHRLRATTSKAKRPTPRLKPTLAATPPGLRPSSSPPAA